MKTLPFFVGGRKHGDKTLEVTDKYTGEIIARVSISGQDDVETAFELAEKSETLPVYRRAEILDTASIKVSEHKEELTDIICSEAGKPIKLALGEVDRCIQTLKFSASVARTMEGKTINFPAHPWGVNRRGFVSYEPIGTVSAISPFNFPLNLLAHKIAPAISAGCPVVAKPASTTPLVALKLAEILFESGLPEDQLAILIGSGSEIGEAIATHPDCKHISFTGSPAVGWNLVKLNPSIGRTLELGSNSAMIADVSWDIPEIAKKAVSASMAYSGQVCISLQRLYVTKDIFDEVCSQIIELASKLIIGNPHDPKTTIGPMVSLSEANRVREWVKDATDSGANLLFSADEGGVKLGAQILANVPESAKVISQEVFGPVLSINPVENLDEAVSLVNNSEYGLQAGVLVKDFAKAIKISEALDVAGVIIGDSPIFRTDQMPYGGIKKSGIGREGPAWAIRDLVKEKLTVFTL